MANRWIFSLANSWDLLVTMNYLPNASMVFKGSLAVLLFNAKLINIRLIIFAHYIKEEGISIPSSYTSYISPLFSPKLHRSVVAYNELKHLETPFVVHFRQAQVLCEPKPLWKFQHPNKNVPSADGVLFRREYLLSRAHNYFHQNRFSLILTMSAIQPLNSLFRRIRWWYVILWLTHG